MNYATTFVKTVAKAFGTKWAPEKQPKRNKFRQHFIIVMMTMVIAVELPLSLFAQNKTLIELKVFP